MKLETVYLVVHIDTLQVPPVAVRAGIYSEDAGSLTCDFVNEFPLDAMTRTATTYDEARASVLRTLQQPHWEWARRLLR